MRFLHTADWHLGRVLFHQKLIEEQAHALDQIFSILKESNIDALLVAGDIYDRAVPSIEAVELLDDFLSRVIVDLKIHVIIIAGNHDSPTRLNFASQLLTSQNLHIIGSIDQARRICLHDESGRVYVCALPYCDPTLARQLTGDESVLDHESAMAAIIKRFAAPADERRVLLAHAFVTGCESTDSERQLSVGGAACISAQIMDSFHYAALGHLHRAQSVSSSAHYSGSLLKYSFSEAAHKKNVKIVDMDRSGNCSLEIADLTPRKDVREIRGYFNDLLRGPLSEPHEDYLKIILEDKSPILDAMPRLQTIYPNLLHIYREDVMRTIQNQVSGPERLKMTKLELFKAFFYQVTDTELSSEQIETLEPIINKALTQSEGRL